MAKSLNRESVVGKSINVRVETGFDRFRKWLNSFSGKNWTLLLFPLLFIDALFLTLKVSFLFLFIVNFFYLSLLWLNRRSTEVVERTADFIGVENKKSNIYYLKLGDSVNDLKEIPIPAHVMKKTPHLLRYPILISYDIALRHLFAVGTTGSGKTTFLIYLLEQHLSLGGGCIIVDGKGDKDIYTDVQQTCIHKHRDNDMSVVNFNNPKESNKMNPLLTGSADDISKIIGNMLETGGDNAFWAGRGLSMMKGTLSVVVPLRDEEGLYNPMGGKNPTSGAKKEPILTFTVLSRFTGLEAMVEALFYVRERNKRSEEPIALDRMESYLASCGVSLTKASKPAEGAQKMHGNSLTMWNEALDLFMGTFKDIFDTDAPDIDMEDIVRKSRVLYILLPATKEDPRTLSMLGKLILAFFKSSVATLLGDTIAGTLHERKKSSAIRPRVPFWGVMDEYGAYAVEGFDNVLAQARSLRVSISILVQELASLEKGSEIDKKRLLGNTAVKVILKVEELSTKEELIKMVGQGLFATTEHSSERSDERSIKTEFKDYLTPQMLGDMEGGHGYISFSGKFTPMLAGFYSPPTASYIPDFNTFTTEATIQKHVVKDHMEELVGLYFRDDESQYSEKEKAIQSGFDYGDIAIFEENGKKVFNHNIIKGSLVQKQISAISNNLEEVLKTKK
jgi:hypothetical protein